MNFYGYISGFEFFLADAKIFVSLVIVANEDLSWIKNVWW